MTGTTVMNVFSTTTSHESFARVFASDDESSDDASDGLSAVTPEALSGRATAEESLALANMPALKLIPLVARLRSVMSMAACATLIGLLDVSCVETVGSGISPCATIGWVCESLPNVTISPAPFSVSTLGDIASPRSASFKSCGGGPRGKSLATFVLPVARHAFPDELELVVPKVLDPCTLR